MNFGPRLSEQQVDMFVSTCRRFMDSLQKCGLILKDRVTLVIPDDDNIRHMPTVLNQHMISKFC